MHVVKVVCVDMCRDVSGIDGARYLFSLRYHDTLWLLQTPVQASRTPDCSEPSQRRYPLPAYRAAAGQVQARHHDVSLPASLSSAVPVDFCTPVANVAARSQVRSARRHLVVVPR